MRQRGVCVQDTGEVGRPWTGFWCGAGCGGEQPKDNWDGSGRAGSGAPLLAVRELLEGRDRASHRPVASSVPCAE